MDPAAQELVFLDLDDASEEDRAFLISVLFRSAATANLNAGQVTSDVGWETPEEKIAEHGTAEKYTDSAVYASHEAPQAEVPTPCVVPVPLAAPVLAPVPAAVLPPTESSLPIPAQASGPPSATAPVPVSMPEPVSCEELTPDPTPGNHSSVPVVNYLPSTLMNMPPVTTCTGGHVTTLYQIPQVMTPMASVYVNNVTANVNVHSIPSIPYPGYTHMNPPPLPPEVPVQTSEQGVSDGKSDANQTDGNAKIPTGPSKTSSERVQQPRRNRKVKRFPECYNKSSGDFNVPGGQDCLVMDNAVTSRTEQNPGVQQEYGGNYVPQFSGTPIHTPGALGHPGYVPSPALQFYRHAPSATGLPIMLPQTYHPTYVNYSVPPPQVPPSVYATHGVTVPTTCDTGPPHQLQYQQPGQPQHEYPPSHHPQPQHQPDNQTQTESHPQNEHQPLPLSESQSENQAVFDSGISQSPTWEAEVTFGVEDSLTVQDSEVASSKTSEVQQVVNYKEKLGTQSTEQVENKQCKTENCRSASGVSVEQKLNKLITSKNESSGGASDSLAKDENKISDSVNKEREKITMQLCQPEAGPKSVNGMSEDGVSVVSKNELEVQSVKKIPEERRPKAGSAAALRPSVEEKKSSPPTTATPQTNNIPRPKQAGPDAPAANPATGQNKLMNWAGLFKDHKETVKPMARVEPFTTVVNKKTEGPVVVPLPKADVSTPVEKSDNDDTKSCKLGDHLAKYALNHRSVMLQPRGLTNSSNWCYVNATLQALLACPSFCNLMYSLMDYIGSKSGTSSTPIIDSMVGFMKEFEPMVGVKQTRKERHNRKEDLQVGIPFEPSCVYKMLSNIKSDSFKVQGRQQDAEEFLSGVLNGLHDEMLEMMKTVTERGRKQILSNGDVTANGDVIQHEDNGDEWQEMGRRNKGCVTRRADMSRTPISDMFMGQWRSALYQTGGQTTANVQHFLTLPLDIQNEKITSVREALEGLVSREPLVGYTCSRTKQEVEATRQITLEELPPVLILHFKRFVFEKSGDKSDGCQKILKKIDFSIDLEISKDLLSGNSKGKFNQKQRMYNLFAVVSHDGKEATKGHWITDVFHAGYGGWIRFDDNSVTVLTEQQVQKHNPPRVPYLLCYRRGDTLMGLSPPGERR